MRQLVPPQPSVDRALDCPEPQQGQHGHHRFGLVGRHVTHHLARRYAGRGQPSRESLSRIDQLSPGPQAAVEVQHHPVGVFLGPPLTQ